MKKIKSIFLGGLIILALLPLLPALIAGSPVLVLLVALFGLGSLKRLSRGTWNFTGGFISGALRGMASLFKGLLGTLKWLYGHRPRSGGFMSGWKRWRLLGVIRTAFWLMVALNASLRKPHMKVCLSKAVWGAVRPPPS